jgi:phenylalanyl-tRNA synthetase beta chain
VSSLLQAVEKSSTGLVKNIIVFDVYQGPGIDPQLKSVALGVILQDESDTLTDQRVEKEMEGILRALTIDFGAKLRE